MAIIKHSIRLSENEIYYLLRGLADQKEVYGFNYGLDEYNRLFDHLHSFLSDYNKALINHKDEA